MFAQVINFYRTYRPVPVLANGTRSYYDIIAPLVD